MLVKCRKEHAASQDCMHLYVNEHNIDTVKWRWIKADRPRKADWDELLAGIDVPPEEAAKSKAQ